MKEQLLNAFLESLDKQTSELINNERVSARERQHLEETSRRLGLDGLLAHSSVAQLMEYYCYFYDGAGCVPEHCELELKVMEQSAKDTFNEQLCSQYESRNQQYETIARRLQQKEQDVEKLLSSIRDKSGKERQRLDKFEMDSSAFVRNQNQKLELQLNTAESSREVSPELAKELQDLESQTGRMMQEYCGQHAFPQVNPFAIQTKTQAIELLNLLDSQIQSAQVKLLSFKQ